MYLYLELETCEHSMQIYAKYMQIYTQIYAKLSSKLRPLETNIHMHMRISFFK